MNSTDRSTFTSTRALFAATAISAVFACSAVFSAAQLVRSWDSAASVSVNPRILTWLSGVQVSAAQPAVPELEPAEAPIVVSQAAPVKVRAPLPKIIQRRTSVRRLSRPAARAKIISPAPAVAVVPPKSNDNIRFVALYRSFRAQWQARLDIHDGSQPSSMLASVSDLNTHVDPVPPAPTSKTRPALRPVRSKLRDAGSPQNVVVQKKTTRPASDVAPVVAKTKDADRVAIAPTEPSANQKAIEATGYSLKLAATLAKSAEKLLAARPITKKEPALEPVTQVKPPLPVHGAEKLADKIETRQAAVAAPIEVKAEPPSKPPAASLLSPGLPQGTLVSHLSTHASARGSHHSMAALRMLDNRPPAIQDKQSQRTPEGAPSNKGNSDAKAMGATYPPGTIAVEAFANGNPVAAAKYHVYSREGSALGEQAQWVLTEAPDYWPTLALVARGQIRTERPVEMISTNSAQLLARLAGADLQTQAGIIYGRVARGWTVETSGRSDRVIYLADGAAQQTADASSVANDRVFALVNAAPGSHLLYAVSPSSGIRVGIAVPVLDGHVTTADLRDIRTVELRGRVLDGSSANAEGIGSVLVRIVGQAPGATTTLKDGTFHATKIRAIGDYPLHLETLVAGGYTHRYRLDASRLGGPVQLFRFNTDQVLHWVKQLEGGVSAESGMVIAAAPDATAAASPETLVPSARTMIPNAPLTPESYRLSGEDTLQFSERLDALTARFVSVQLPEGPALVSLDTQTDKTAVSEVVFASPGVLNVVGPY